MHAKFLEFGGIRKKVDSSRYQRLGIAEVFKSRSWMYDYIFRWSNGKVLQVDSDADRIELLDDESPSANYPLEVAAMIYHCNLNKVLSKISMRCKRCGNITNASVSEYSLSGLLKRQANKCYISKKDGFWSQGCSSDS